MNKKIQPWLRVVLALALILAAEESLAIRLELEPTVRTAPVGKTVTYRVAFHPETDIPLGGGLDIVFDPEALAYDSHVYGPLGDPLFQRDPDVLPGRLESFTSASFNGLDAPAVMVTVVFRVLREGAHAVRLEETRGIGGPWIDAVDFASILHPDFRHALAATQDATYPLLEVARLIETPPAKVGSMSLTEIPVHNAGTGPLTIASAELSNLGFGDPDNLALQQDGCSGQTLAAGATCLLQLAHTPTQLLRSRRRFTQLIVTSSDLVAPTTVAAVEARIASPLLEFEIADFFDGAVQPPYLRQTIAVTNRGQWPAEIEAVEMIQNDPPDTMRVIEDTCTGQTVSPSAACSFSIQYVPRSAGKTSAWLAIIYNDTTFLERVRFNGYTPTGIAVVSADGPTEFEMFLGEQVRRRFTLHNRGSMPLTLHDTGPASDDEVTVVATDCPGSSLQPDEFCFVDTVIEAIQAQNIFWIWRQFTDSHVASSVATRLYVGVRVPRVPLPPSR